MSTAAMQNLNSAASNFSFLGEHDAQLVRLGMLAEKYFPDDPNTCLLKLRQLTELLAQLVASRTGLFQSSEEGQYDLLRRLQDRGLLPREITQLFGEVRRAGNAASHAGGGDHRTALALLRITWQLGVWYHRTFKDRSFKSGPFIPPVAPKDESELLRAEMDRLTREFDAYRATHAGTAKLLEEAEKQLKAAREDQSVWEHMAADAEMAKAQLSAKLQQLQTAAAAAPAKVLEQVVAAADQAAQVVELDEADTRKLIDEQLRAAGWEADTELLRYASGSRPERGKNRAIAEWPTKSGPADYVLFIGLNPVGAIEAKRRNVDVAGALSQAKRYARGFESPNPTDASTWGEYRLPFVFSSNGRPYLKQLETRSGIWFADLRRSTNLSRALDGWYTPEGLSALLKIDTGEAEAKLAQEGFEYGFPLRPYQKAAIQSVEKAIAEGQRAMLLAMATGTGKTKTCVALIYRLLKTQRFNRVLFLVDRTALGEQAADAFTSTRMENLNTFSQIFGIKEIDESVPDTATKVHIATVQGMVARLLNAAESAPVPAVDAYDCIVVDECHRGYLLDRELSNTELQFRGYEDYVSKYRKVIEYFDAVKVGLTATPALHTVQIFGQPVFTYSYREAVIDRYLVDYEPPIQIRTKLSTEGIHWAKGEKVQVFDPRKSQIELFNAPDEIKIEVEDFNRKVITESFNRVVCQYLAKEIDPSLKPKTLIFCANDAHADLVVKLLKEAFAAQYGEVDDEAVMKITGAADRPLELFRRYKNEGLPRVAVTVDLLTTGIDVPEICNLVFIRRVNSRILFDQMLGRATRLCDEIGKEYFRVFDAVRLFEAVGSMTAMQPVVVNPALSFKQLIADLCRVKKPDEQQLILDQLVAKLQRKKRHLDERAAQDFEVSAGAAPDEFIRKLRSMSLKEVARWFTENPDLGEILDRKAENQAAHLLISTHADSVREAVRGYGTAQRPQDYIEEFKKFIQANGNAIPALTAVLKRPRELTRKQLREVRLVLDRAGYPESALATAFRDATNQDIAAGIIGYIRQAAMGDPLKPFEQRVDEALAKILASRKWSGAQRQWLEVIAAQTKANVVVDREALDDQAQLFKQQGGGFARLNKVFDGELGKVLAQFNESMWPPAA
jgi:type I restriction enzyme, R subunit